MAHFIELKLINDAGTPNAYPGIESQVQANLLESITPVWIGVSADGLTNQAYPLTTPIATIKLTYPRVYQGTSATVLGETMIYNNGELDVARRIEACCVNIGFDESSPGPSGCTTCNWSNGGSSPGRITILLNGNPVVDTDVDGSGSFDVNEGDVVNADSSEAPNNFLVVTNDVDGDMNAGVTPFEFTVECGKVYTIAATHSDGE
jgi:hypothetical protein